MKISIKDLISFNILSQIIIIFRPPMIVFLFHIFLSRGLGAYIIFPWIDIPMHFLGGLTMAYSLFLVLAKLQEHKTISRLDKIIEWTLVFALVATIAVFWEFAEFTMDRTLGTNVQISLANTMQDLFMGILGASAKVGYKILKNQAELIL